MNPNPLVRFLEKPSKDFTKNDIINYVEAHNIEMINFRYVGGDGRLKTLNFVINCREHLDEVLSTGERVDGSSLFKNVDAASSDLYVVPRYRTAFRNPFSEIPAVDILCSFFDKDGNPFESSPEYVLHKAVDVLHQKTGLNFQAMGELEYYIIAEKEETFQAVDQKGYHESGPFSRWNDFRQDAMKAIAYTGGTIKYGHSEVGNFTRGDYEYEQNEIEFLPVDVEAAADQLVIAKWVLRNLAWQYGVDLTFAPKITVGKAGSGMHIHTRITKDGKNMYVNNDGSLSDIALKAIAGFVDLASSLTAFGNTIPTSYFRLVPHQEAPTNICWGDRNRSVLVRVPLGWKSNKNMAAIANPNEPKEAPTFMSKQTVEFRCPDASADIYLLMAGLVVAARHGLEMEEALVLTEKTYVDVNIFADEHKEKLAGLKQLPTCCVQSAKALKEQAEIYQKYDVFPSTLIEGLQTGLIAHDDDGLHDRIKDDSSEINKVVKAFFYCG